MLPRTKGPFAAAGLDQRQKAALGVPLASTLAEKLRKAQELAETLQRETAAGGESSRTSRLDEVQARIVVLKKGLAAVLHQHDRRL